MTDYQVVSSTPTTYLDPVQGVVNGVLVRFRMVAYNEIHEVRIPSMNAALAKSAIEQAVTERDALSSLSQSSKG